MLVYQRVSTMFEATKRIAMRLLHLCSSSPSSFTSKHPLWPMASHMRGWRRESLVPKLRNQTRKQRDGWFPFNTSITRISIIIQNPSVIMLFFHILVECQWTNMTPHFPRTDQIVNVGFHYVVVSKKKWRYSQPSSILDWDFPWKKTWLNRFFPTNPWMDG